MFNYAHIMVIISVTLICILEQMYDFVLQIHVHAYHYIIK